jgi:hypothetical protein
MSARSSRISPASAAVSAEDRVAVYNWQALSGELGNYGCAVLLNLLSPDECRGIADLYSDESHFRSHIHMARHGFGKGEYRYFKYPLPQLIGGLRTALYPHLATIANEWNERMGVPERYPDTHASFLKRCHDAGQARPTPLLLQYVPGDFNCLHQDLYGDLAFPIQLAILLLSRARISPAASSYSPSNGRACKAVPRSCHFGKATLLPLLFITARCKDRRATTE